MKLFRDGERTSPGRILPGQSPFAWLEEAAKPGADSARAHLQAAFDHLPNSKKASFVHKLQQNTPDHYAAVVEIYAHEMLRQSGFSMDVEWTSATGSVPEFLARSGAFTAQVEVTVDLGPDELRRKSDAFDDVIMAATAKVQTPGFGVFVRKVERGSGNLSTNRFVQFLDDWFQSVDHAAERAKIVRYGYAALDVRRFTDKSGWSIEMMLWPLDRTDRRLEQLSAMSTESAWSEAVSRLKNNIRDKLKQHRDETYALVVVAVCNEYLHEPDHADAICALYGTEAQVNWADQEPGDYAVGRVDRNAGPMPIWMDNDPLRHERLAGVVVVRGVYPWSFDKAAPELWDNPHLPEAKLLRPWPFDRFSWRPGKSLRVIPDRGSRRALVF